MRERRTHPRKAVHLGVHYLDAEGRRREGAFRDLSIGGGFIACTSPLAYAQRIAIEVHLPGLEGEVTLHATVRWIRDDGMGVQFDAMGARETHALLRALES